jgi:signal peptidase I
MTTVRHPVPEVPTRRLGVGRALHGLLRVTEWVVLGVAVAACVVFSVGTLTGRLQLQTVPTGSMEPVIPKGSAIMVEHQDVSTIQVGDVIVFAAPETGTMTVHRVIEIGETDGVRTFTTKGDNNPGPDPWNLQLSGQRVHKVAKVLPVLGTVLTDAGKPRVRIALMVVGGLLVLIAGFFAIWRRDERRREERRMEERRQGDRRQSDPDAPAWPVHLERRVAERRVADRRVGDRRHDDQQCRSSETRVAHDRTADRDGKRRTHSSIHALSKTLGMTVAAIAVMTLIPTTVAHASFTGSETVRSTVGTGSLAVPSNITCRWTSATATSLSWSLDAGIQTNTQALQQTTSTGAITVAATVASSTTSASVSPTAPVTTPRYLSARTTKGTWTSAQSAQITTDRCGGAVVLLAGNGTNAFAGDGGAATAASLNTPNLVDEGPDGRVFIADTGNNRVRVVATNGTISTFAGGGANTACTYTGAATGLSLSSPQGVAVDDSGNVYIADTGNNCIRKVDTSGNVTRVAGGGATTGCTAGNVAASAVSLSGPAGVAVVANGDVIVADTGRNCIRRISGTTATRVAGGGATTTCSSTAVTASALLLAAPQGVAVAANGDVIVADTGRNCVRRISGTSATLVAGGGSTTTCTATTPTGVSLSAPEAVAIAPNGDIVIADTGRACVRRATATAVTQLAFTGSNGSSGDNGPAIAATVRSPAGLSVTAAGDLLVSDRSTNSGNADVRRIRGI